ncbi:glycosyltransferase family 4 protein [Lutibacter sp.]|uniref:glycosyltransferase family 4 protein n=1 Tax=Lutibacter sp. TaxID=1925666 RepID=UPI003567EB5D
MKNKKTVLIVVNVDWFFISHRLCIATQAIQEGWSVVVIGKDTGRAHEIEAEGIQFVNISFTRSGVNPLIEVQTIFKLLKLYRAIKPDLVHHITFKPIIYGSLITKFIKVKGVVNAISGLGYNFSTNENKFISGVVRNLMKVAFHHKNMAIIFQNKEDFRDLKSSKIISDTHKLFFIKGSGVNLGGFQCKSDIKNDKINILFPSRMIWEKGVKELIEAANLLYSKYQDKIIFKLYGIIDYDSKSCVPESYLLENTIKNYIEWYGYEKNISAVFNMADIVVFPSYYREGMPKTLLEACAAGKPIITTDSIGCKECVEEGYNGYKVPVKSGVALANAIEKLINAPEEMVRMGKNSRAKAEKEFDQKEVVLKHMEIYNMLSALN